MSYIEQIAFYRKRRDEVPNQELAALLAEKEDGEGIAEIAAHLEDKNKSVSSDCIKVLYEIGYLKPRLIMGYAETFLDLLNSRENRMVWGGMIACSSLAVLVPDLMMSHLGLITEKIEKGSVITHIHGIKTLINLCKAGDLYKEKLYPFLLDYSRECRPVDFAKRIELMTEISSGEEMLILSEIVEQKRPELSDTQYKRALKAVK